MALFDLLGRSWAMGIVWNLSKGALSFRELQKRCESLSPTTLNKRIKELRETGIVKLTDKGYTLTPSGKRLYEHLLPLSRWSKSWARRLRAK
jgi:DNA-binding HxlR family transcriptional regulator